MTNREKYGEQLMKISFRGNCVAISNGVPVGCDDLSKCSGCDFEGADDCRELYHEWLNAEADETPAVNQAEVSVPGKTMYHAWMYTDSDETPAVKPAEVSVPDKPMTRNGISIEALKDAYIKTVNDVISGDEGSADDKLDMSTMFGAWLLYKRIYEAMESGE